MGQKLSDLRKTGKANEDVQCPRALNENFQRMTSSEENIVLSSSNEIETTQSSFIVASSETSHVKQETENENAPVALVILPTELILAVARYLPPSSYMSLSYSCRTIRNKMGVSFAHVLGDKVSMDGLSGSALSIESRNVRYLERLELWSVLVRDGNIPSWKAFYSGRKLSHDYSLVSTRLFAPVSREHRCLGSAGRVWVCPHRILDYNEATMSRETTDVHGCGGNGRLFLHGRRGNTLLSRWPIMRAPQGLLPSHEEVKEALRPLHVPMCPHLRLNDACIASIYHPDCRRLRWETEGVGVAPDCQCRMCSLKQPRTVTCQFCDTRILFYIRTGCHGLETLNITTWRILRDTWGCIDRAWISQLARPADFDDYERAWQVTMAECWRKVGPISYF